MGKNVEFHGKASEWFGIWIVNVVLTILTIGIYSAWAKVRRNQYFYRNTTFAGRSFDYHATGKQILIGRLIVIAGLIAYSLLAVIPLLAVLLPIGFIVLFPFLLMRSLRFNARVSSWSGVRFNFNGSYKDAFVAYLLVPFLTFFTLYLAWPFAERVQRRYVVNNHTLGRSNFHFDSSIGPFYAAFFFAVSLFMIAAVVAMSTLTAQVAGLAQTEGGLTPDALSSAGLLPLVGVIAAGFMAVTIFKAMVRNIVFNATILDGRHRFGSNVSPLAVTWIAVSNTALVLCSLGLLLPWAQIRLARYFANHTEFMPEGSLDDFIAHKQAEATAIGDAYTDIEGVDFGINI
ncbi:MAG: YjgN family protein [Pseudomonadota bacterium]